MALNRSKFKEALNGLNSDQRTALLYLEKQINKAVTTKTPLSPQKNYGKEISNINKKIERLTTLGHKKTLDEEEALNHVADTLSILNDIVAKEKLRDDHVTVVSKVLGEVLRNITRVNHVLDISPETNYKQATKIAEQGMTRIKKGRQIDASIKKKLEDMLVKKAE